jgi:hypothetical protein
MASDKAPEWFSDMLGAILEGCADGVTVQAPCWEIFKNDKDPRSPGIEDVILCEECTQKLGKAIVLVESGLAEGVNIMSCNWGEDGETAHAAPGD